MRNRVFPQNGISSKLRLFISHYLGIFLIVACSGTTKDVWSLSPAEQKVLREVDEVLSSDPCQSTSREACRAVTVSFDRPIAPEPDDDVILVIDEGLTLATLALHQHRVLNHYRLADSPNYFVPYQPQVEIPTGMHQIFHHVFKGYEPLASSKAAMALGRRFEAKYRNTFGGSSVQGHGAPIFNLLAELNPYAKFVIVHNEPRFSSWNICDITTPGGAKRNHDHWKEKAEALVKIATQYHIKWVNYSAGWDRNRAKHSWQVSQCDGPVPSDEVWDQFVRDTNVIAESFSQVPGLLFVQAGADPSDTDSQDVEKFYGADCVTLPQRLRVGFLNLDSSRLSPSQERDGQLLSLGQRLAAPCTDLFVRDGLIESFLPSKEPIYFTATGFSHAPLNISGTSYATPVGLSFAAYLMKDHGMGPKEVVRWIRGEFNEPLLVAPFAERKFLNRSDRYLNF